MSRIELAPDGTPAVMIQTQKPIVFSARDVAKAFINSDCMIQAAILMEMVRTLKTWESPSSWAMQCQFIQDELARLPESDQADITSLVSTLEHYT